MDIKKALIVSFASLIFLFGFELALAALPSALNYQGYLTDSNGVPVDGDIYITFRIYNTETDITPQWMDSQTVTVNQGIFSVELGSFTTNPFPPGMFENPLWIGLSVGSDAEMTPRRPITSTGFAYKADDANTLDGISASTLDQSAHVTDMSNPHNVTASQVGAADINELATHIANSANPHSVTAAQAGAASSVDFTAHASNSAAHHTRYTNSEAVGAMGAKNDANALNHNKYSNANAVAAILAADGAGSTLDADKVDGLQASELIDAAQDEVRTPISSLPYTISQSGSYYLTGNLDGSSGGISISADDVTLDLMGFTIDGGGAVYSSGIYFFNRNNITIRNGTIKRFGYAGIHQSSTSASHATLQDVQVLGNGIYGTAYAYSGIYVLSANSHVERCTAGDNGGSGIVVSHSARLINNTAYNNSGAFGIRGDTSSYLSGNTAYNNSATGILGYTAAYLTGNTAYNNSGVGIYGSSGASLIGNTAYSNGTWGMEAFASNMVMNNTIYRNNLSDTVGQGGLFVGGDSRVFNNTLDGNEQSNIYVNGSDNVIEKNHLNDSNNGILFNISGNYYLGNTGAGNTNAFNLNGTTQTDGGGNVAF